MEAIIDKIYGAIYFDGSTLSFKEKTIAVVLGLGPFLIVGIYFIMELIFSF